MKTIILVLSLLVSAAVSAQQSDPRIFDNPPVLRASGIQQLVCGDNTRSFTLTMDSNGFDTNSDLFHPLDARFRDNFYTADLMTCVGSTLYDVSCMGYINGISEDIIEVKLKVRLGNKVLASYSAIRGRAPSRTLNCNVE